MACGHQEHQGQRAERHPLIAVQREREAPQERQAQGRADNRAEPDPEHAMAQPRRGRCQESHHRRVVEVPPGEVTGEQDVVRFVDAQAEASGEQEPHEGRERHEAPECPAAMLLSRGVGQAVFHRVR